MKPVGLRKNHPSSNLWKRRYRVTNEELYQIIGTTLIEDFNHQQQLKWLAYLSRRENTDIMKRLNTTKNKRIGRKPLPVMELAIRVFELEKNIFLKNDFNRKFF